MVHGSSWKQETQAVAGAMARRGRAPARLLAARRLTAVAGSCDGEVEPSLILGAGAVDLDELYRQHHRPMVAWARRCLGSEAEAQDAVSESFERFLRARPSIQSDDPAALRAYLFTILKNCIIRPRPRLQVLDEDILAAAAAAEAETEPLWKTTSSEDLQAAIVRLPEGLRTPLLLAAFERISHRAIAERMSISTLAVTMRLFRAKRTLKRLLEEQRAQQAALGGATRQRGLRPGERGDR